MLAGMMMRVAIAGGVGVCALAVFFYGMPFLMKALFHVETKRDQLASTNKRFRPTSPLTTKQRFYISIIAMLIAGVLTYRAAALIVPVPSDPQPLDVSASFFGGTTTIDAPISKSSSQVAAAMKPGCDVELDISNPWPEAKSVGAVRVRSLTGSVNATALPGHNLTPLSATSSITTITLGKDVMTSIRALPVASHGSITLPIRLQALEPGLYSLTIQVVDTDGVSSTEQHLELLMCARIDTTEGGTSLIVRRP